MPQNGDTMKLKPAAALPLVAGLGILSACNSVKVHSWSDPEFRGRPLGKTMVLAIGESDSRNRQYEALFVERLGEHGIEAQSLHAHVQHTRKLSEAELVAMLEENGFDSIIVTRPLSETERQQLVDPGYRPHYYRDYWGFYNHAWASTYSTAYIQTFVEWELESNLYDVESRKLAWTGRKVVYDDRTDESNMKAIIRSVIKDWRKQGMVD
jgi:hypothetical protein